MTPELAKHIVDLATAARRAEPRSPHGAPRQFLADFTHAFGELRPPTVRDDGRLVVVVLTPLEMARRKVVRALTKDERLPDVESLMSLHSVVVEVLGGPLGTPFVLNVAVFRNASEIPPMRSTLEQHDFWRKPGERFAPGVDWYTLHASTVEFPIEAFAPDAAMKIVCATSRGGVELALTAADVARMR